ALFVRAAQEPGDSIEWTAQSGRCYRFRICRDFPVVSAFPGLSERERVEGRRNDFFEPLTDPDATERTIVTESDDPDEVRFSWIDPDRPNRVLRGPRA